MNVLFNINIYEQEHRTNQNNIPTITAKFIPIVNVLENPVAADCGGQGTQMPPSQNLWGAKWPFSPRFKTSASILLHQIPSLITDQGIHKQAICHRVTADCGGQATQRINSKTNYGCQNGLHPPPSRFQAAFS